MGQVLSEMLARDELVQRGWTLLSWNGDRHGSLEFCAHRLSVGGDPILLTLFATPLERTWSWEVILDRVSSGRMVLSRGLLASFDEDAAADLIVRSAIFADEVAGRASVHDEDAGSVAAQVTENAILSYWPHSAGHIGVLIENLAADELRAQQGAPASVEEVAWALHDPFMRELAGRGIAIAIRKLHPDLRTAIWMHYGDGLSISEIAERTNLSESTVKRQIDRAIEQLRREITIVGMGS